MAFNQSSAERIRKQMEKNSGFVEKKMFGGICFLLNGNMACGILNDDIIVRVGKEAYEECLASPHTRQFDITGKSMTGWVMVSPDGYQSDAQLKDWLQKGIDFAQTLPPK